MVSSRLNSLDFSLDMGTVNLKLFHNFLEDKSNFFLRIMKNPNLLEHEAFTDLLMAVFHLKEELIARKSFTDMPEADIAHLAGDMTRAYKLLVFEWLLYMRHLQKNYPYLFSLAVRMNPFDTNASPVIT
jgi:hypothetical protein